MDEKKESVEIVEKCKEILRYLYKPDYHSSNLLDSSEIIQTAKNLKRDLIQSLFEGKYITNFNDEGKDEYTNFLNEIIQ